MVRQAHHERLLTSSRQSALQMVVRPEPVEGYSGILSGSLDNIFSTTSRMKALVTGFDPFGGGTVNASYEAVRRLPARIAALDIVTAELPTSFARAPRRLRALMAREQPDIMLCVGLAAERKAISVERIAVNLDDARLPDNDGAQPVDRTAVRGGPAAYFSSLPLRRIVARLEAEAIPCELSMSAGTFVCNHVFYALMHLAAQQKQRVLAGFVHVPDLLRGNGRGAVSMAQAVCGLTLLLDSARRAVSMKHAAR